jgi:multimeric flavodoxin WrbA
MKILSINSSPRTGGQSKTELMLNHLVEGMQEAGAEVEVINLARKKLRIATAASRAGPKPLVPAFKRTI